MNKGMKCHIHLPKLKWPEPVHPTVDELEESLPGFRDQYIPNPLTPEILMDYFKYVLPYTREPTPRNVPGGKIPLGRC